MKQLFNSLTSEHIRLRQHSNEICRQFSRSPSKGNLKRLKQLFAQSGEQVIIEGAFYCDYGDKISLGDRVYINTNCTILDGGDVNIGSDCMLGPNVQLLTVSHDVDPIKRLNKYSYVDDIVIGNNVWLGAGVIVLAGVTIGDNSVVGAGSVVIKDIPANKVAAGNPAAVIKSI
jgi:maltose O-acetyltransferase